MCCGGVGLPCDRGRIAIVGVRGAVVLIIRGGILIIFDYCVVRFEFPVSICGFIERHVTAVNDLIIKFTYVAVASISQEKAGLGARE
jgi:hypothetical protein